jgi:hypothetical protein
MENLPTMFKKTVDVLEHYLATAPSPQNARTDADAIGRTIVTLRDWQPPAGVTNFTVEYKNTTGLVHVGFDAGRHRAEYDIPPMERPELVLATLDQDAALLRA